jgi:hypothetical protein
MKYIYGISAKHKMYKEHLRKTQNVLDKTSGIHIPVA